MRVVGPPQDGQEAAQRREGHADAVYSAARETAAEKSRTGGGDQKPRLHTRGSSSAPPGRVSHHPNVN